MSDMLNKGKATIAAILATAQVMSPGGVQAMGIGTGEGRRLRIETQDNQDVSDFTSWGGDVVQTEVLDGCFLVDTDCPDEYLQPRRIYFCRWSDGSLTQQDAHPHEASKKGCTCIQYHSRIMRGVRAEWGVELDENGENTGRITGDITAGGFGFVDAMLARQPANFRDAFKKWQRGEELTNEENEIFIKHRTGMGKQMLKGGFERDETTS